MADLDLDELERLAKAAGADWDSKTPTMPLREFHTATYPPTILALIERVKRAEAVIAEVETKLPWWESKDRPHVDGNLLAADIRTVLATYQNGADQ